MEAPQPPDPRLLAGVPVLVVEDDRQNAKLLALLLSREGALVEVAHSAEEAWRILEGFRPHAIVVDLVLPLKGGLLFVEEVKWRDWAKDVPVVAVSSITGSDAVRVALAAGCVTYVRKPIDVDSFARTVAGHLGVAP